MKTRGDDDDFAVEPGASVHHSRAAADERGGRREVSPGWEKKLGVEVRKRRSVRSRRA